MQISDEIIEMQLLKAVQQAALAAHAWVGKGDAKAADAAATEAMRSVFASGSFQVHVVIGEGERDESPMLHRGERLGGNTSTMQTVYLDCAVDPLDGTSLVEKGLNGAITIAAFSEPGGLLGAPDFYMEKIVAPAQLAGKIWLSQTPEQRVTALATHLNKTPQSLRIAVQDRPRHSDLVDRLRNTGAHVELFAEGDIVVALQSCQTGDKFDCFMGIGAAPEGVITAAAVRCLGGVFLGRFVYDPAEAQSGLIGSCKATNRSRLIEAGILDPDRHYEAHELASGKNLYVAMSGITDGEFVRGVCTNGAGAAVTESLITSSKRQKFERVWQ
jgi:fructose-1,6-bisphosphatase II / sedoheptulose-1,7-bisphosphatase